MDWVEFGKRREKAPATARVPLCADGEAMRELEEAQRSTDSEVRKTIPALRERVAEATMQVTVAALAAEDYIALKESHRPSDPEKVKKGHEWDEATFAPALIAAAVDPPLTLEEATELWLGTGSGALSLAERAQLFLACRDLNETVPDLSFIEPGIGETTDTGRPSTTAPPEG